MFDKVTLSYWQELRSRLIKIVCCFFLCFLLSYLQSNKLYLLITKPIENLLGQNFILTSLTDGITTPLKLSWYVAWLLTVPCFFYHLWRFLLPALYETEKRYTLLLIVGSVLLFYMGVCFAIWVISPMLVTYMKSMLPQNVHYWPDMRLYMDFMIDLAFCLGWAFELPVALVCLSSIGWLDSSQLRNFRRYFILVAFTLAMFITPPDVLSQTILAVPICLIYELGLAMVWLREKVGYNNQVFRSDSPLNQLESNTVETSRAD